MLGIAYDDYNEAVFFKGEAIAVLNVTYTVALSAVARPNFYILWVFNSNSERFACIFHIVNTCVRAVEIVLAVQ